MQLLQRLSIRLREENVDKHDLETQPDHVDEEVFPVDVLQADGIDEGALSRQQHTSTICRSAGNEPNMTAVRPKSWNHDRPFVRT